LATVFIGNLSPEVSDSDLREVFGAYGKITSIRLMSRRGLAFVELSPEGANAAVEALKGVQLKGRTVDVALERSSGGRPKGRRGRGGSRRR
jgi:RNA recognition motif-containing protein